MSEIVGADGKSIKKEFVEREIPEKLLEAIKDKEEKGQTLIKEYLNVSITRDSLVQKILELVEKIRNNETSLNDKKETAFKKMKLNEETNYKWIYSKEGKFIGVPVEKKK